MINEVTQLKFTQWLHTSPDRPYEEWLAEITASARTDAPPLTFIAICTSDTGEKDLAGFVSLVQIPENAGFGKQQLGHYTLCKTAVPEKWHRNPSGAALYPGESTVASKIIVSLDRK